MTELASDLFLPPGFLLLAPRQFFEPAFRICLGALGLLALSPLQGLVLILHLVHLKLEQVS